MLAINIQVHRSRYVYHGNRHGGWLGVCAPDAAGSGTAWRLGTQLPARCSLANSNSKPASTPDNTHLAKLWFVLHDTQGSGWDMRCSVSGMATGFCFQHVDSRASAGISGAFVGANDEYFAVLALDRATIEVYESDADELPKRPHGSAVAKQGGILALFPGPKLRAPP